MPRNKRRKSNMRSMVIEISQAHLNDVVAPLLYNLNHVKDDEKIDKVSIYRKYDDEPGMLTLEVNVSREEESIPWEASEMSKAIQAANAAAGQIALKEMKKGVKKIHLNGT